MKSFLAAAVMLPSCRIVIMYCACFRFKNMPPSAACLPGQQKEAFISASIILLERENYKISNNISKICRTLYVLMLVSQGQMGYFPAQSGTDNESKQNFCCISREIGDDSGSQSGSKRNSQLLSQPDSSEQVAYSLSLIHI